MGFLIFWVVFGVVLHGQFSVSYFDFFKGRIPANLKNIVVGFSFGWIVSLEKFLFPFIFNPILIIKSFES